MFGFLLWRLPAGGRLVRPFARGSQRRTLDPALGQRSDAAALGQAPQLTLSVDHRQDMTPWIHPGRAAGASSASASLVPLCHLIVDAPLLDGGCSWPNLFPLWLGVCQSRRCCIACHRPHIFFTSQWQ